MARQSQPVLKADLQPYEIKGRQNPIKRNLFFAGYKTSKIRRTFGSLISLGTIMFSVGTINLLKPNLDIELLPVRLKEKYRAKDVFKFSLDRENGTALYIECRALLKVREKFRLLQEQDSSFWGAQNTDCMIATIVPGRDTANRWGLVASNLNATKGEKQKGKLACKGEELSFEMTSLLLKESNNPQKPEENFITLNNVYAFTYKGEIVGAVSVKEAGRKFWIKNELDDKIKDAIAATASILTIRKNLYR